MYNQTKKIKILVIDDDETTNFITSIVFSEASTKHELSFELSAESALQKLNIFNNLLPDIILLDLNMPGMNGWEFLDQYQNMRMLNNKKIPIFILSSSMFDIDKRKARGYSDVIDYIEKPFDAQKINLFLNTFNEL